MQKTGWALLLAGGLAACGAGARDGRSHALSATPGGEEVNIWMSYYSNYRLGTFQAVTLSGLNCTGDVTLQPNTALRFPIRCNDGTSGWAEVTVDPTTRIAKVAFTTESGFADKVTLADYPHAFP